MNKKVLLSVFAMNDSFLCFRTMTNVDIKFIK